MRLLSCCTLLLAASSTLLLGSRPAFWKSSTQEDFLKGTFSRVGLTSDGRLVQAPEIRLAYDTGQAFIYSAAVDRQGNVLAGTGSEGKLFRLPAEGEAVELADFEEPGVYGLAVRQNGEILAASAPDGKVYRLGSDGAVSTFFDPEEKYIWDLALDPGGNLFVATGPNGRIFKVEAGGRHALFYDSPEQHIVDLAWDAEGYLLAGSSPGGLLLKINSSGRPFVLLDSMLDEIRAVHTDRYGNIYAVGISSGPAAPKASPQVKAAAAAPKSASPTAEATIRTEDIKKGLKLELYRVDREGLVEVLYSRDAQTVFDLLVRQTGEVLMGTGTQGRLLSLTPARLKKVLGETADEQITRIVSAGDEIILATSNLGKLYRLTRGPASSGTFESDALDARVTSIWGRIRWQVTNATGEGIQFSTRSGNTKKPDDTWSDWAPVEGDQAGSTVKSPPARFLQWKVDFSNSTASTALLSDRNGIDVVEVSYLQKNVAPRISEISIHAPGSAFLRPLPANQLNAALGGPDNSHFRSLPPPVRNLKQAPTVPPRRVYTPSSRSVSWKAGDLNGDDLVFDVYLRARGKTAWRALERNWEENYYTLDGASVPDGVYAFKIVVSDRISNPPDQSLESSIVSKPFTVANHRPTLEVGEPRISGDSASLRVEARTRTSDVYQFEYSVDGGVWSVVHPSDGLADSQNEIYEVKIEGLQQGRHSLFLRVVDSVGNLGTGRADFTVP